MAEVAVASSVISAVMETAGYLTQEYLLDNLNAFVQSLGIFLFVCASIGGVVSVAIFGSYKYARYLLLGPILFGFLIHQTDGPNAVVPKLGDGSVRLENGAAGSQQQAEEQVRALVADNQEFGVAGAETKINRPIRLAWPFKIYTKVVGSMINQLSGVILRHENDEDLLFASKTQAMDMLLNQDIEDKDLLGMFQGDMLGKCNQMMTASLMIASPHLSSRREQDLLEEMSRPENQGKPGALKEIAGGIDHLQKTKAFYERERALGSQQRFDASPALRRYMLESQDGKPTLEADGTLNYDKIDPDSAAKRWLASNRGASLSMTPLTLTCGDGWEIVEEKIWLHGARLAKRLQDFYEEPLDASDKGLLCVKLAQKVGLALSGSDLDSDKAQCKRAFPEIAAIFLIRQGLSRSHHSQIVQRVKDEMQGVATVKAGTVERLDAEELTAGGCELVGGTEGYEFRYTGNAAESVENPQRSRLEAKFSCKGKEEWHPITVLSQIAGSRDSALVLHQQWQMAELRQKIFTAAMHFPYYQGLLLYLLSILYPFVAVIVVFPGRAGAFLNFLCAWLWIKSWDLGFAFVIILDKVLWNTFPTSSLETNFAAGEKIADQGLPVIMAEAFRIDPSFHLHAYYFFLSMALFAIPAFTGFAVLHLRRNAIHAMTSPFIDGLKGAANDAAMNAGNAYGYDQMNKMINYQRALGGQAELAQGFRGAGTVTEGRHMSASFWSNVSAAGKAVAEAGKKAGSFEDFVRNAATAYLNYEPNAIKEYGDMVAREAKADAGVAWMFDKRFGRTGKYQHMVDAASAAMDGGGGFEINIQQFDKAIGPRRDLFVHKVNMLTTAMSDTASGVLGLASSIPEVGNLINWAATVPGIFESAGYVMYAKDGRNILEEAQKELEKRVDLSPYAALLMNAPATFLQQHPHFVKKEGGLTLDDLERIFSYSFDPDKEAEKLSNFTFPQRNPMAEFLKQRGLAEDEDLEAIRRWGP